MCHPLDESFELMRDQILHILSASLEHAQQVLSAALAAGFRESGAVSLAASKSNESNPMVAVRSAGYSFDAIIGYQDQDCHNVPLVDERYLEVLSNIANDRFRINTERIARFRTALLETYQPVKGTNGSFKPDWEDAEVRRRRKREEGLARQRALNPQQPDGDSQPSEQLALAGSPTEPR